MLQYITLITFFVLVICFVGSMFGFIIIGNMKSKLVENYETGKYITDLELSKVFDLD